MSDICKLCQYDNTDECLDCIVIFERYYKAGISESLLVHRNFIEKPIASE